MEQIRDGSPESPRSPKVKDPRVYKTELCKKWETNAECPYGSKCQFAHGLPELRPRLPMSATGTRSFSFEEQDGKEEQKQDLSLQVSSTPRGTGNPDPRLYKTELCRSYNRTGYCRYGLKCQFAHGIRELRPSPRLLNQGSPMQFNLKLGTISITPSVSNAVEAPIRDLSVLGDSIVDSSSPRRLRGSPVIASPKKGREDVNNGGSVFHFSIAPASESSV